MASIGVFDSGFGGLHILRGIIAHLPEYDYVYLGDTARTPYGTRSKDIVYDFTRQAVDFLFERDCGLVILACNTASSDALKRLQEKHLPERYPNRRLLGVLVPAAEAAAEQSSARRVGVIATEGTVASEAFVHELRKLNPNIEVFQKACPLLVPFVEAGEHESAAARLVLQDYLDPLIKERIDTLILGCTHYGILEPQVRSIVGPEVTIISEAGVVPPKLRAYLARHQELNARLSRGGKIDFYSTDLTERFKRLGGFFFGRDIDVRVATLD